MRSTPSRGIGGFTLLELLVALAVIGVCASVLLERLLYYEEAAEKASMEYVVNVLKVGLQARIGHLMAQSQVVDFIAVAHENPVTWVDVPIPGYRGEVVATPDPQMPGGSWYYDRTARELVYVAGLSRYLEHDAQRRPRVHFRVKVVRPEDAAARDDMVLGLQLVPAGQYRWF